MIFLYLLIGMLVGMTLEMMGIGTGVGPMTMTERLVSILFWPVIVIYFIIEIMK